METYLFPALVCVSLTSRKNPSLVTMVTISELKTLNISLLLLPLLLIKIISELFKQAAHCAMVTNFVVRNN